MGALHQPGRGDNGVHGAGERKVDAIVIFAGRLSGIGGGNDKLVETRQVGFESVAKTLGDGTSPESAVPRPR